jgi:recombination protein RecA
MARKKAEEEESPGFDAMVARLRKKYPGKIFRGDEYTMPWLVRRLPTGVLGLDIACHGGLPAGGLTMLVAAEGIGKNWLANQVIRNQQRLFGDQFKGVVVSMEMPYDKQFARSCGVRVSLSPDEIDAAELQERAKDPSFRFTKAQRADLRQQVGELVLMPPSIAEESLEIACQFISSRECNVVLIDSFGSMLTELEQENELKDPMRPGGNAGLNSRFATKLNAAMAPDTHGDPNLTCIIGINQMRDNMKKANPNSPDWSESGGHALKHGRFLGILMRRESWVNVKKGEENIRVGKTITWEITKQKAGGHEGDKGKFDFIFDLCGIDYLKEAVQLAVTYGVVKKEGIMFEFDGYRAKGLDTFCTGLREAGDDFRQEIESRVLTAAGIRANWTD